jgi:D-serine deaminase-like pyridoxal phosphate-dependent protein
VSGSWDYVQLRETLKAETLPALLVNMEALDRNIRRIAEIANRYHKKIRIATKSIRIPYIIDYILRVDRNVFNGVMCFSVYEAQFLSESFGIDDILLGYPIVQYGI